MEIRTSVISVGDIDTVGQQFKCDFYLSATWQEPQLQGKSPAEVRPQCSRCLIILTAWIFFTFFFTNLMQNPLNLKMRSGSDDHTPWIF